MGRWQPIHGRNNWKRVNDGRQSGEEKQPLYPVLQGGVAGASHCNKYVVRVRNARTGKLVKLMMCNRTIVMMLTNQGMWTNIIARTAALLSLEFAIASTVYAAMYVRRIVPATKKFPYILQHVSSTSTSVDWS